MELDYTRVRFKFLAFTFVVISFGVQIVQFVDAQRSSKPRAIDGIIYPFFAVVASDGQATCCAVLYTTSRLVTACHCLLKNPSAPFGPPHELQHPEKIKVVIGCDPPLLHVRYGKLIKVHPKCQSNTTAMVYDYGVVEVSEPFEFCDGQDGARDIFAEQGAMIRAIHNPGTIHCKELDFDSASSYFVVRKGLYFIKSCEFDVNKHGLDFIESIQICANRTSSVVCGQPDHGTLLICQDVTNRQVLLGMSSGRNRLYCGGDLPRIYARMDAAVEWLRDAFRPDPKTNPDPEPTRNETTEATSESHTTNTGLPTIHSPTETSPYRIPTFILFVDAQQTLELGSLGEKVYPFFAVVKSDGHQSTCCAVLYTTSRLVTACHCLLKKPSASFGPPHELQQPENIKVLVGCHPPLLQVRYGRLIRVHPRCQSNTTAMIYDFGMIEVSEPFELLCDGQKAPRDIFAEQGAMTQAIQNPGTTHCEELDYDSAPTHIVVVRKGLSFIKSCELDLNKHGLNFKESIQVCANRNSSVVCGQVDHGTLLICQDVTNRQVLLGISSGRNHPYCGGDVPGIYARMDAAVEWLRDVVPPDPTTSPVPQPTGDETTEATSELHTTDTVATTELHTTDNEATTNLHPTDTGSPTSETPTETSPYRIPTFILVPRSSSPKPNHFVDAQQTLELGSLGGKVYPFFAVVKSGGHRSTCCAVLYTTSRLVTACHCLLKNPSAPFGPPHELQQPEKIKVLVGCHPPLLQVRYGSFIMVHPQCQSNTTAMVYDFGMIEVSEPFELLCDGQKAPRDIFAEQGAMTQAIHNPGTTHCEELDYDSAPTYIVVVRKGLSFIKSCEFDLNKHGLNFKESIQVCANQNSSVVCGQPDHGTLLICEDVTNRQVLLGMSSGRNHPYCGGDVPGIYARMDAAVEWLRDMVPPDPTTRPGPQPTGNETTEATSELSTTDTGSPTSQTPTETSPYRIPTFILVPRSSSPKPTLFFRLSC
ncbi:hypothetical protein GE061_005325 [Apolygus lucorum]|uniref:Peptidase S1 domain-containing protein n=1 Tax=Apolygus lucorum TaxID=248454 RepID=A0A8S9WXP9_APOLU|nr:hypothetical protein GE061_005325 [Apolygus lucorum]